jgi:hypothetical protein
LDKKPSVEDTALVTIYTEDSKGQEYEWTKIVKPFNFTYYEDENSGLIVTLNTDELDGEFVENKNYFVCYAFSNDPTMLTARDSTSLGYFRYRVEFPTATCIDTNPPKFKLDKRFENYLLRSEREIFDSPLEEVNKEVEKELENQKRDLGLPRQDS